MWEILTKIPLKSLEWPTYSQNYQNIPKTTKRPKKKEKKKKKPLTTYLTKIAQKSLK